MDGRTGENIHKSGLNTDAGSEYGKLQTSIHLEPMLPIREDREDFFGQHFKLLIFGENLKTIDRHV